MKVTRKDAAADAEVMVPVAAELPAQQSRKIELPTWAWAFLCVALPLILGTAMEFLTASALSELLAAVKLPPLFPPETVFKAVWLGHYVLMGIASYLVLKSGCAPIRRRRALIAYAVQLAVGAAWVVVFSLAQAFMVAVGLSLLFMAAIAVTMDLFTRCSDVSGKLLVPCLLWASFLSYYAIGIALLN